MAPYKCCVGGCNATSSKHKLFCMPSKAYLRNMWLSLLVPTNPNLLGLTENQLLKKRVCEKHFDETQFDEAGVRIRYSYPCLFTEMEIAQGIPLAKGWNFLDDHTYCQGYEEEPDNSIGKPVTMTDLDSESSFSSPLEVNSVPDFADAAPAKSNGPIYLEAPALAKEILQTLSMNNSESFAPKIKEEISELWGQIIINGLSKESLQTLTEKILIPENFKLLKAPALNTEMAAVLSASTINRDKRLEEAQNHLGIGIAAITNLMSTLIDGELKKIEVIKKLFEVGQVLLDLHCQNTSARRNLITCSLDKKCLPLIRGVKRDSLLFGETLADKLKRTGLQIKRTFVSTPTTYYRVVSVRQVNPRGSPRTPAHRGKRCGRRYPPTSQNNANRRSPPGLLDLNSFLARTKKIKLPHKN